MPLGTTRDLAPFPVWLALGNFGVPNLGGAITTASGLTFIGATTDHYLRAFETETRRGDLARAPAERRPRDADDLPAARGRTPVRRDRRRAATACSSRTPGDALMAFALP